MRRWLPYLGIALGIGIAVYALFFGSSDEEQIRELLARLEAAVAVSEGDQNVVVRGSRIKKEFSEIFAKEATAEIPELGSSHAGRNELIELATAAPQAYRSATVALGGLSIDIDPSGAAAVAFGGATLNGVRLNGELERDTRTVSLTIEKIDGEWRIVALSVAAKSEPEE